MQGKITLITPPDFFENNNESVLFMHLSDAEQDIVSKWLSKSTITSNVNFYVYIDEVNVSWLLYALNRCEHKYINMNYCNSITQALGGYMLGKSSVHYSTSDANTSAIYSHINQNRVDSVEKFLEAVFGDQTN